MKTLKWKEDNFPTNLTKLYVLDIFQVEYKIHLIK